MDRGTDVPDDAATGIPLSRAFFDDVVAPLLSASLPRLRFGAGRLGTGSDVLGFDDDVSRDHDWGLRLSLFVPADAVGDVSALLDDDLPDTFRGLPTRFAFTGESPVRHHVEVTSVREFAVARLGFDPRDGIDVHDWLSVSGQAALEVTAGAVFADPTGELGAVRRALAWYPDDLWRYVLASDWERIAQELPLMARAAEVGDDIGSRIIAARLSQIAMHLGSCSSAPGRRTRSGSARHSRTCRTRAPSANRSPRCWTRAISRRDIADSTTPSSSSSTDRTRSA